jgi:hypothetical protein
MGTVKAESDTHTHTHTQAVGVCGPDPFDCIVLELHQPIRILPVLCLAENAEPRSLTNGSSHERHVRLVSGQWWVY